MSGTLYPTQDGRWVTLTMPDTDRWWPGFAPLVGLDVRRSALRQPREALRREPARADAGAGGAPSASKPAAHWRAMFQRAPALGRRDRELRLPGARPAGLPQPLPPRARRPEPRPHADMLGFPIFMSETPARLDRRGALRAASTRPRSCTTCSARRGRDHGAPQRRDVGRLRPATHGERRSKASASST